MLPPGIFIWESGAEGLSSATSLKSLSRVSKSWSVSLAAFSERHCHMVNTEVGHFLDCGQSGDSTIVLVEECTSSMEVARFLQEKKIIGEWAAVIAVRQSHGRGQLRRPWISKSGNLHVSLLLPVDQKRPRWENELQSLHSLVCGYVFSEALAKTGFHTQIKWPNDFLQYDRKVGGMLLEEKNGIVILGIGMNLTFAPSDEDMRSNRAVPAAILKSESLDCTPLSLCSTLVNNGKKIYENLFDELDPQEFLTVLASRLAWLGHRVRIHERESEVYCADIIGISPRGGLVIRREGKESVLFSGSILPL